MLLEDSASVSPTHSSLTGHGATAPVGHHRLVLALECERPTAGAEPIDIGHAPVIIGRGPARVVTERPDCLRVRVPDSRMCHRHARLGWSDGTLVIEDLSSRHGTRVNGRSVHLETLADGDVVELGSTLFVVQLDGIADGSVYRPGLPWALQTRSPRLTAAFSSLARVAGAGVPVVITGESGCGKQLVAQALHDVATRTGAFVAIDCTVVTDAGFEAAVGEALDREDATLFLDEVSALGAASQARLLEALDAAEIARVIVATCCDLRALARDGAFRADLCAKLSGFCVGMPGLRDRRDDLGDIIASVLTRIDQCDAGRIRLSPAAGRALMLHDWPGNIRELQSALGSSVAHASADGTVDIDAFPAAVQRAAQRNAA